MLVLSIDHRVADTSAIATIGRVASRLRSQLDAESSVRGVVVLATCARVEAYVDASSFHGPQRAFLDALTYAGIERDLGATMLRSVRGTDALEHLFRVTAGLESAVVGEAQVSGQVRDALLEARARGTSTRSLDLAFENAIRVSRQARAMLSNHGSVAGAALDELDARGDVAYGTALVIGTGAFASACIAELRERGAHTVWTHSPSGRDGLPEGADHLVSARELASALALSDVAVTASGHGPEVITAAIANEALTLRSSRLVLVDLAASADVEASIDDHPDIDVLRIGDIARDSAGAHAAALAVRHEARVLYPRIEGEELDNLIVSLRQHVQSLAEAELGPSSDPAAAETARRITRALLHSPTEGARAAAANGELDRYRAALEAVFGLAAKVDVAEGSAA